MSEQIDIAVDLGVVPPPLPDVEFLEDFAANLPETPTQIVDGMRCLRRNYACISLTAPPRIILQPWCNRIGPEFLAHAVDRRQRRRLYQRRAKPWGSANQAHLYSRAQALTTGRRQSRVGAGALLGFICRRTQVACERILPSSHKWDSSPAATPLHSTRVETPPSPRPLPPAALR